MIINFGKAILFGPRGFAIFVVEDRGEKRGVVAEELFVERVMIVLFPNVEIDEGATQKSANVVR